MSKSAQKILTTAQTLFNQHSFTAVGVDLIRDVSGCSKTTLYSHYKNKQQLINAVLHARDAQFQHELNAYVQGLQGLEGLLALIDWHVMWFLQDDFKGCLFIRAVAEADPHDRQVIEIAQQHKQQISALITQFCQQLEQEKWSDLIYTLVEGLISRCLIEGVNMQMIEQLKAQIQMLLIPNKA